MLPTPLLTRLAGSAANFRLDEEGIRGFRVIASGTLAALNWDIPPNMFSTIASAAVEYFALSDEASYTLGQSLARNSPIIRARLDVVNARSTSLVWALFPWRSTLVSLSALLLCRKDKWGLPLPKTGHGLADAWLAERTSVTVPGYIRYGFTLASLCVAGLGLRRLHRAMKVNARGNTALNSGPRSRARPATQAIPRQSEPVDPPREEPPNVPVVDHPVDVARPDPYEEFSEPEPGPDASEGGSPEPHPPAPGDPPRGPNPLAGAPPPVPSPRTNLPSATPTPSDFVAEMVLLAENLVHRGRPVQKPPLPDTPLGPRSTPVVCPEVTGPVMKVSTPIAAGRLVNYRANTLGVYKVGTIYDKAITKCGNSTESIQHAIRARLTGPNPRHDPNLVKAMYKWARQPAYDVKFPLERWTLWSRFNEWNRRYPSGQAKMNTETMKIIEASGSVVIRARNNFIKDELRIVEIGKLVEAKVKPRIISGSDLTTKVLTGPACWTMGQAYKEHWHFNVVHQLKLRSGQVVEYRTYFTSGATPHTLGKAFTEVIRVGCTSFIEEDKTNMDGSVSKTHLDCEAIELKRAGFPALPLRILRKENEACKAKFQGVGLEYDEGSRKSGSGWTSGGNSAITNKSSAFAVERCGDVLFQFTQGDDSLLFSNEPIVYNADIIEGLGFYPELTQRKDIFCVTFCSGVFYRVDELTSNQAFVWGPFVDNILLKMTAVDANVGSSAKQRAALYAAKIRSLACWGNVPVVSALLSKVTYLKPKEEYKHYPEDAIPQPTTGKDTWLLCAAHTLDLPNIPALHAVAERMVANLSPKELVKFEVMAPLASQLLAQLK